MNYIIRCVKKSVGMGRYLHRIQNVTMVILLMETAVLPYVK